MLVPRAMNHDVEKAWTQDQESWVPTSLAACLLPAGCVSAPIFLICWVACGWIRAAGGEWIIPLTVWLEGLSEIRGPQASFVNSLALSRCEVLLLLMSSHRRICNTVENTEFLVTKVSSPWGQQDGPKAFAAWPDDLSSFPEPMYSRNIENQLQNLSPGLPPPLPCSHIQ